MRSPIPILNYGKNGTLIYFGVNKLVWVKRRLVWTLLKPVPDPIEVPDPVEALPPKPDPRLLPKALTPVFELGVPVRAALTPVLEVALVVPSADELPKPALPAPTVPPVGVVIPTEVPVELVVAVPGAPSRPAGLDPGIAVVGSV